jgi:hypothetical protein
MARCFLLPIFGNSHTSSGTSSVIWAPKTYSWLVQIKFSYEVALECSGCYFLRDKRKFFINFIPNKYTMAVLRFDCAEG